MVRSFADPDTEFAIERSGTPVDVDGFKLGEPTGDVCCLRCGGVNETSTRSSTTGGARSGTSTRSTGVR